MNYNRTTKNEEFLKNVQEILDRYKKDVYDVSAGFRIIDYFDDGYIKLKPEVTFYEYMNEHKHSREFRIIRLARKDRLEVSND